jgi:hypothetical protein
MVLDGVTTLYGSGRGDHALWFRTGGPRSMVLDGVTTLYGSGRVTTLYGSGRVTTLYGSGRVTQVRPSVPGPKKMGRSPFNRSYSASKRRFARARALVHEVKALEKHRFRPSEPGAPVQNHRPWLGAVDRFNCVAARFGFPYTQPSAVGAFERCSTILGRTALGGLRAQCAGRDGIS